MNARLLHPLEDLEIFRAIWGWWDSTPRWFRETVSRPSWEKFQAETLSGRFAYFGLFDGEIIKGVIVAEEIIPGFFEIHTQAARRSDVREITKKAYAVGYYLFEKFGAREVSAWIPAYHHSNLAMAAKCGLERDGSRYIDGQTHKRLAIWVRLAMGRERYLQDYQGRWALEEMQSAS